VHFAIYTGRPLNSRERECNIVYLPTHFKLDFLLQSPSALHSLRIGLSTLASLPTWLRHFLESTSARARACLQRSSFATKWNIRGNFFLTSCRYAFPESLADAQSVLPGASDPEPWLDTNALSRYSGSSLDSITSTFTYQSGLHPAPHPSWQYHTHGQHPQNTWNAGQQGLLPSHNFDVSSALPLPQENADFGNFNDPAASLWNLDGFDFSSYTPQPWMPAVDFETLMPTSDAAQVDLATSIEPQEAITAPLTAPVTPPPPAPMNRVACSHGCGKTYRRAGDCRRHMLKHGPPKFKCIVIGCDKTFHRADKLRAHVKQGHKMTL
jgi:hypothetical protein